MKVLFIISCSLFLFSTVPQAYPLSDVSKIMEKIRVQEPSFEEIAGQALRGEKLGWGDIENWKKKMKLAPWFPTMAVGYDHALRKTSAISISDNVSVTSSGVTVGPDGEDLDETLNRGSTLRFRASWYLDEIVFNPKSFQATQQGRELSKARLSFGDYLFKIYAERRRLQAEYYLLKGQSAPKILFIREEIEVLTQRLNLLTSSIFSDRWWRI